ncbi:MAG: amidohydrolase family protein, partial [Sciscionella sp.]
MQSPASDQVLTGGTLCTPEGIRSASWLRISRGRIAEIGEGDPPAGQRIDARDCWVVPGFIDIHCHGGGGFSFIEEDLDAVRAAAAAHARHGTTTMLASLVSRPVAELAAQVSALRE